MRASSLKRTFWPNFVRLGCTSCTGSKGLWRPTGPFNGAARSRSEVLKVLGVCPCSRPDNGDSAVALFVCIAVVLAVNLLWRRWSAMSAQLRGAVLVGVVLLIVGWIAYVRSQATPKSGDGIASVPAGTVAPVTQPSATATMANASENGPLPRIVDLGAKKCIPCKRMAPILQELKTELVGKAEVEFIDITENRKAAALYEIRVMPTQILFDRSGKETWRHEGFLAKEDILARLREAGMQ